MTSEILTREEIGRVYIDLFRDLIHEYLYIRGIYPQGILNFYYNSAKHDIS